MGRKKGLKKGNFQSYVFREVKCYMRMASLNF